MKTKDLKIGEEYSLAAPNSYDARFPLRVRVVKFKVYGPPPKDQYYQSQSANASYVEFEPVDETKHVNSVYTVTLTDGGKVRHWRSSKPVHEKVHRALPSHFLRTWSEHLDRVAKNEAYQVKRDDQKEVAQARRMVVVERLRALGIGQSEYGTSISLSVVQTEQLLGMVGPKKCHS